MEDWKMWHTLTALQDGQRRYILLVSDLTLVFCPLQKSQIIHPLPLQGSHIIPESTCWRNRKCIKSIV